MSKGKIMFLIYRIYQNEELTYVGRTKQPINARLRGHCFHSTFHKHIPPSTITKVEVAECKTEADMFLYEIYYINKLKPKSNKDDKSRDDLTVFLPELIFTEHKTKLIEKWITKTKKGSESGDDCDWYR